MLEKGTKVFGDWTIDEHIGSGAFGAVYKIRREEFDDVYYAALKVINIPQDPQDQLRLRSEGLDNDSINTYYGQIAKNFLQEIKLLSSLDGNTNIVDYKDHSVVKNGDLGYTIYIRMQLLTPLNKKLVNDEGNAVFMDTKDILALGIDMCSALELCERHKIIHRDIKIDNIFESASGDYKLGDFGIAKQLEATQGEMSKKGTMMYMAPEVFRGENYNNTADIYSLGIVLYRLLNKNRSPFFPAYPETIRFSDKETANLKRLSGAELPAINGVSDELMRVLRKACAFIPSERYQTATELRKALKKVIKSGNFLNVIVNTEVHEPSCEEITDNDREKTKGIFSDVTGNDFTTTQETTFVVDDTEKTVSVFGEATVNDYVTTEEFNSIPKIETETEKTESVFSAYVQERRNCESTFSYDSFNVKSNETNPTEPKDEKTKKRDIFLIFYFSLIALIGFISIFSFEYFLWLEWIVVFMILGINILSSIIIYIESKVRKLQLIDNKSGKFEVRRLNKKTEFLWGINLFLLISTICCVCFICGNWGTKIALLLLPIIIANTICVVVHCLSHFKNKK